MTNIAPNLTEGLDSLPDDLLETCDLPVISATVIAASSDVATCALRDGTTAILPRSEFFANRSFTVGRTYLVQQVQVGDRSMLSVTRPGILVSLLAGLAPEIRDGRVRVMGVARVPGVRTKLAVAATVEGVEPIAVALGRRANRVKFLAEALAGERVDIVGWDSDRVRYLERAMAPAQVNDISIDDDGLAIVRVPAHLMPAAVGQQGLNSLLAGRLVGVRVSVEPS